MYTASGKISSGKQLASQDDTVLQIHALTGSGKVSSGKQLASQDDKMAPKFKYLVPKKSKCGAKFKNHRLNST